MHTVKLVHPSWCKDIIKYLYQRVAFTDLYSLLNSLLNSRLKGKKGNKKKAPPPKKAHLRPPPTSHKSPPSPKGDTSQFLFKNPRNYIIRIRGEVTDTYKFQYLLYLCVPCYDFPSATLCVNISQLVHIIAAGPGEVIYDWHVTLRHASPDCFGKQTIVVNGEFQPTITVRQGQVLQVHLWPHYSVPRHLSMGSTVASPYSNLSNNVMLLRNFAVFLLNIQPYLEGETLAFAVQSLLKCCVQPETYNMISQRRVDKSDRQLQWALDAAWMWRLTCKSPALCDR